MEVLSQEEHHVQSPSHPFLTAGGDDVIPPGMWRVTDLRSDPLLLRKPLQIS